MLEVWSVAIDYRYVVELVLHKFHTGGDGGSAETLQSVIIVLPLPSHLPSLPFSPMV